MSNARTTREQVSHTFRDAALIAHWLDKMWPLLGCLFCRTPGFRATSGCNHIFPMRGGRRTSQCCNSLFTGGPRGCMAIKQKKNELSENCNIKTGGGMFDLSNKSGTTE